MALFNWGRRAAADVPPPVADRPHGFDLTSSRLLAVRLKGQQVETLSLDGSGAPLPLAIGLAGRQLEFGRSALQSAKRTPHFVCNNYLPYLGQSREWSGDHHRLSPESALLEWACHLRDRLAGKAAGLWAFPSYLDEAATRRIQALLAKAKLEVNPTHLPELALVADRAAVLWQNGKPESDAGSDSWHPAERAADATRDQALVMILQADCHALSASLVRVQRQEARLIASTHSTKFGEKAWFDRMLDALADRCVRLCRRDPRDSADSEQMLFDQVEPMLDGVRFGRKVTVTVRASTWYQDLLVGEEDLALLAKPILKPCVEMLVDWLQRTTPREMPTEVWLRAEAGRLPGLAVGLHENLSEQTRVRILPADAVAAALARLGAGSPLHSPERHRDAISLAEVAS